jgi:hypothetical protein
MPIWMMSWLAASDERSASAITNADHIKVRLKPDTTTELE